MEKKIPIGSARPINIRLCLSSHTACVRCTMVVIFGIALAEILNYLSHQIYNQCLPFADITVMNILK